MLLRFIFTNLKKVQPVFFKKTIILTAISSHLTEYLLNQHRSCLHSTVTWKLRLKALELANGAETHTTGECSQTQTTTSKLHAALLTAPGHCQLWLCSKV